MEAGQGAVDLPVLAVMLFPSGVDPRLLSAMLDGGFLRR